MTGYGDGQRQLRRNGEGKRGLVEDLPPFGRPPLPPAGAARCGCFPSFSGYAGGRRFREGGLLEGGNCGRDKADIRPSALRAAASAAGGGGQPEAGRRGNFVSISGFAGGCRLLSVPSFKGQGYSFLCEEPNQCAPILRPASKILIRGKRG